MRIIHVEDFFNPNAGYQINILPKYLNKLGHENIILTTDYNKSPPILKDFFGNSNIELDDKRYSNKYKIKIIRLPIYTFKSGRAIWKISLFLKKIRDLNPDLIYFHGNDTYISIIYLLFFWRKRMNIISDSHMLDMASKNKFSKIFRKFYRYFVSSKINKNNIFVIRVQDSNFINKEYAISTNLTPFISFGTDIDLFDISKYKSYDIKKTLGLSDERVYLYTGKLDESKGGEFLARAFQEKFEGRSINLVIIGNIPDNKYGENIKKILANSENNIILLPTQKYNDLPKYYSIADFAVFPKQCSLSFYDLQSMGIPVIFEDNEINRKRLWNHSSGNYIFKQGSIEEFRNTIVRTLKISKDILRENKNNAIKEIETNFNYNIIAKEYEKYIKRSVR